MNFRKIKRYFYAINDLYIVTENNVSNILIVNNLKDRYLYNDSIEKEAINHSTDFHRTRETEEKGLFLNLSSL